MSLGHAEASAASRREELLAPNSGCGNSTPNLQAQQAGANRGVREVFREQRDRRRDCCRRAWRRVTCMDRGVALILRHVCELRLPRPLTSVAAEQTRALRFPFLCFALGMLILTAAGVFSIFVLLDGLLKCVHWPSIYVNCVFRKALSLFEMPSFYVACGGWIIVAVCMVCILRRVELAQRIFSEREGAALQVVIDRLLEEPPQTIPHDAECVICCNTADDVGAQEDGTSPARWRKLPCGHGFHEECLLQWLQRSHRCPLCRHDLHRNYA
eukprot:CAMPEP_0178379018 /NCGR_PEP_ID=MMETSP0689_2-20121128/4724_1 /TAXON_ID=160604 /ORGANISM="Amphidinium massartii, Strain CS-259" /LENGTH=269 /DNA_ID=CAMNT_0019999103 /DNA_START=15 /DNA_END=820 /DNA_ORIENTATION=-